jgi:hypothetical protein
MDMKHQTKKRIGVEKDVESTLSRKPRVKKTHIRTRKYSFRPITLVQKDYTDIIEHHLTRNAYCNIIGAVSPNHESNRNIQINSTDCNEPCINSNWCLHQCWKDIYINNGIREYEVDQNMNFVFKNDSKKSPWIAFNDKYYSGEIFSNIEPMNGNWKICDIDDSISHMILKDGTLRLDVPIYDKKTLYWTQNTFCLKCGCYIKTGLHLWKPKTPIYIIETCSKCISK